MGKLFEQNEVKAKSALPILEEHLRTMLSILRALDGLDRSNLSAIQEVCLLFLGRMKRHALDCLSIQSSQSIQLINRTALEGQMLFEWIYGKAEGREDRARRYLNLRIIEFAKARALPIFQNSEVPSEWDQVIFEELGKISPEEVGAQEFNELMTHGDRVNHSKRFSAYLLGDGSVYTIFKAVKSEPVYETSYKMLSMFEHWNPAAMPELRNEGALEDQFSSACFVQVIALWDMSKILLSIGKGTAFIFGQPLIHQLLQGSWNQFEEKTNEWGEWP